MNMLLVKNNLVSMMLRLVLIVLVGTFLLVMAGTAFDLAEPFLYPLHLIQGEARFISNNVIIGPYPHAEEIKRLKRQVGVVEVISLMDPDIPFERGLIRRENDNADDTGVAFKNYPMSFLSLHNGANLAKAQAIAYYIKKNTDLMQKAKST